MRILYLAFFIGSEALDGITITPNHEQMDGRDHLRLGRAVEHPHIVLLSVRSAQLFGRAKAASTFLQFIAKDDCHLTVRGRDPVCEDQGLAIPLRAPLE